MDFLNAAGSAGVSYGYLAPVVRPLEWTLRQIEAHATRRPGRSSWGWAIVLATFVVNLVLFPFRVLAARNARAVKATQPRMDAINARYKGGRCEHRPRALSGLYVIAGIGGSQRLGSIC